MDYGYSSGYSDEICRGLVDYFQYRIPPVKAGFVALVLLQLPPCKEQSSDQIFCLHIREMDHGRCDGRGHIYGLYRIQWDHFQPARPFKKGRSRTGNLDYQWHSASAGVLPVHVIRAVVFVFVRLSDQKTSGM